MEGRNVPLDVMQKFFKDTSETGRHVVVSFRTGKKYFVEPIGHGHSAWGDWDPATKKFTGKYGGKYTGSVTEKESLITEANGFKNIEFVQGGSPYHVIEQMDAKYPDKE